LKCVHLQNNKITNYMNLSSRIEAFEKLGFLLETSLKNIDNGKYQASDTFNIDICHYFDKATAENGWFIPTYIRNSISELIQILKRDSLINWLSVYNLTLLDIDSSKKVSIVMAGNLPLVGFHDLLSVLITGHIAQVKLSQKDTSLTTLIIELLTHIEPQFKNKIEIITNQLKDYNAVIATGSNNTKRYFEYYFKDVPSIIRGHKNSVAVIIGNETDEELHGLTDDLFLYFGLGCRSISKLYLPTNYKVESLFPYFDKYHQILYNHHKYMNNYLYHKSILMVNKIKFLENGFVMMNENSQISSPISVIHYEYYNSIEEIQKELIVRKNEIQCIASNSELSKDTVRFGQVQKPALFDYADGIDVIDFLLTLKK